MPDVGGVGTQRAGLGTVPSCCPPRLGLASPSPGMGLHGGGNLVCQSSNFLRDVAVQAVWWPGSQGSLLIPGLGPRERHPGTQGQATCKAALHSAVFSGRGRGRDHLQLPGQKTRPTVRSIPSRSCTVPLTRCPEAQSPRATLRRTDSSQRASSSSTAPPRPHLATATGQGVVSEIQVDKLSMSWRSIILRTPTCFEITKHRIGARLEISGSLDRCRQTPEV